VIAVLGGLGAAVAWAVAVLTGARASRVIGPTATLAWVMLIGLVAVGPVALADGRPAAFHGEAVGWFALAGVGNVAGLLLVYAALRIGRVGVVVPIESTEGAVAALIAVAAGEPVGVATSIALLVVALGVVLAVWVPADTPELERTDPRAALLAIVAAGALGASLYATGHISGELPLAWAVLPPRVAGVAVLTIPLALAGRLRMMLAVAPLVVASALAEVTGFLSFGVGARHGIALAAVLASQYAAVAVLVARIFFGERLGRRQIAGAVLIAVGVAAVSALRAA
jgi:drug/metabolite transporter (DMT)-like permease